MNRRSAWIVSLICIAGGYGLGWIVLSLLDKFFPLPKGYELLRLAGVLVILLTILMIRRWDSRRPRDNWLHIRSLKLGRSALAH